MLIQVLKSKLSKVIVTKASTECEGSITLDSTLMEAAHLKPYERVEVNAVNGKERLVTYVIRGDWDSGQVEMNGGMANFFKPGDEVHVNCFMSIKHKDYKKRFIHARFSKEKGKLWSHPIIVKTDENNKVILSQI